MATSHNRLLQNCHLNNPEPNGFLQALDELTAGNLLTQMELIPLTVGKSLQHPGVMPQYAYFPTTCVVSLLCGSENGSTAEIAVIGNEGMVGVASIIGADSSPIQAVVQSSGYAYRIHLSVLRKEFLANPELQSLLMKYMQSLMSQIAQTAVCNRHHTIDQQLCRWFLHCLDRHPTNELVITQEFIAQMLGVRREGVTAAAGKLQKAGIINYRRGHVSILDRTALEARACECYGLVRKGLQHALARPAQEIAAVPKVANAWHNKTFAKPTYASPLPKSREHIGARV